MSFFPHTWQKLHTVGRFVQHNCFSVRRYQLAENVLFPAWYGKSLMTLSQGGAGNLSMERRVAERFPLSLPMTVRWITPSGLAEAQTKSEDVSSRGIYFCLSKWIEDGSPVEVVMTLPNEITSVGRMHVCCTGRVQRTEVLDLNRIGMAVQLEHYEFLRGSNDMRGLIVDLKET